jgi:hypothetical protein
VTRIACRPLRAGLAVLLLLTGACSLTLDATRLGVPASLATAAGTPAVGDSFSVTSRAVYGFWGAVKFSQPSLRKTLAAQLVGGKEVTNVRIRIRSKFSDLLITALTVGLVVPRAVTIDGVIVEK